MAISISNVTVLNSDGVNAAAAVARQGTAREIVAAADKEAASPSSSNFSSISLISASGKAKLSLESLQARAGALLDASAPPTVSDFKVAVQGVVSQINSVRSALTSALSEIRNGSSFITNAKGFIDHLAAANKGEGAFALARKIGIESQSNGSFTINQKQLTKAFNEDGKGAFAALQEFAAKLAQAKDAPPPEKVKQADDTAKSKEAMRSADAAARSREADRVQQAPAPQTDSPKQDTQVQLDSVSGFTAQAAVTSYLTVAAL